MPASPPTGVSCLSLHDALPIFDDGVRGQRRKTFLARRIRGRAMRDHDSQRDERGPAVERDNTRLTRGVRGSRWRRRFQWSAAALRSEEHTSELPSPCKLVCRLRRPLGCPAFPSTTLFRSSTTASAVSAERPSLPAGSEVEPCVTMTLNVTRGARLSSVTTRGSPAAYAVAGGVVVSSGAPPP